MKAGKLPLAFSSFDADGDQNEIRSDRNDVYVDLLAVLKGMVKTIFCP